MKRRFMNGTSIDLDNPSNGMHHTYTSSKGFEYDCYTSGFHDDGFSVWVPELSKTFWVRWDKWSSTESTGENDEFHR